MSSKDHRRKSEHGCVNNDSRTVFVEETGCKPLWQQELFSSINTFRPMLGPTQPSVA